MSRQADSQPGYRCERGRAWGRTVMSAVEGVRTTYINVHFVHGRKVGHVLQPDVNFDNLVHARARELENGLEIVQSRGLRR